MTPKEQRVISMAMVWVEAQRRWKGNRDTTQAGRELIAAVDALKAAEPADPIP